MEEASGGSAESNSRNSFSSLVSEQSTANQLIVEPF